MFCTYCKVAREENEAPCHNCGAPSSLLKKQQLNDRSIPGASWKLSSSPAATQRDYLVPQLSFEDASSSSSLSGSAQLDFSTPNELPSAFWQVQNSSIPPQTSFPTADSPYTGARWVNSAALTPLPDVAPLREPEVDATAMGGPAQMPFPDPDVSTSVPQLGFDDPVALPPQEFFPNPDRSSMLPALYQPQPSSAPTGQQPTLSLQLVPEHAIQHLLPAITESPDVVHITPAYTTPRPLISRKRAINGFLSVLIVVGFLCAGSAYFIRGSGVLQMVGIGRPISNIASTPVPKLSEPPKDQVLGPAAAMIPSAATSSRFDKATLEPALSVQDFTTSQTVYVTYTVQLAKQDGQVSAKWYTNNQIFYTQKSAMLKVKDLKANDNHNGLFEMRFVNPAECRVELWWNNQLAKTIYFVVR
jgi:hypothetical protein